MSIEEAEKIIADQKILIEHLMQQIEANVKELNTLRAVGYRTVSLLQATAKEFEKYL